MSKSVWIGDRNSGFWAFDVVSDTFTKHLLEVALEAAGDDAWLRERIDLWAGSMECNLGLGHIDDLTPSQKVLVQKLIRKAVERLRVRPTISAAELGDGDHFVDTRGIDPVPTEPVARFGMAVFDLLAGTLPKAPEGCEWYYEIEHSPGMIRNRRLV